MLDKFNELLDEYNKKEKELKEIFEDTLKEVFNKWFKKEYNKFFFCACIRFF